MAKNAQQNSVLEFDVIKFGKNIFNSVNAYRMRKADIPAFIKNNPGAAIGIESSINAFYRIIGFQRYRGLDAEDIKGYVEGSANDIDDVARANNLNNRATQVPESTPKSREDKILAAVESMYRPQFVKPNKRLIFPLVWTAGVDSVPVNRVIEEPFAPLKTGQAPPRSLLEAIIEIRVNRFGTQLVSENAKQYFQQILENLKEAQKEQVELRYGSTFAKDYTVFSLLLLKNFNLIVDQMVKKIYEIEGKKVNLLREINYIPSPTQYGSPLRKNNNIANQFNKKYSHYDNILSEMETYKALIETSGAILIDKRQSSGKDASGNEIDFVKDNVFMTPFINIFQSDIQKINKEIATVKEKIGKLDVAMEEVRAINDLFYGTTSGFSIVDVFAILWALFEIDREHLLGLLNTDQRLRYNEFNKQRDFQLDVTPAGLVESYNELERIVINKINLIEATALGAERRVIRPETRTQIDDEIAFA